jgi:AcrR family transcriptional regulator
VLQVGAQVFAELGLNASMSVIAERTGLTRATLYRHFSRKEELLYAILTSHLDRLAILAEEIGRSSLGPVAAVEAYLESAVRQIAPDRAYFHVALVAGAHSESIRASERALHDAMLPLLARAQAVDALRKDLTPSDLHLLSIALGSTLGPGGPMSDPPPWRRHLALIMDALALSDVAVDEPPVRFGELSD